MLTMSPNVFLVGHNYQIILHTTCFGIAWVEVQGQRFIDEDNGLLRSETLIHRVTIPTHILDEAKVYTVCFQGLPERKTYFPQLGEIQRQTYNFRPVDMKDVLQICHIADTHSHIKEAVILGQSMLDKMDLLVLNGDIPAESKSKDDLLTISEIVSGITSGERPVVFARGNHDLRGKHAIELTEYVGHDEGCTYFTFRSGGLWGVVLDCGEDKSDDHPEYGGLVYCHGFRERQTAFLKNILLHSAEEYNAPGITVRLAICHVPFLTDLMGNDPQFDIEERIYAEWTQLLCQMNIDLMLCGHEHALHTYVPNDEGLRYGTNFPVLVASEPCYGHDDPQQDWIAGAQVEITDQVLFANYVDNLGKYRPALNIMRK